MFLVKTDSEITESNVVLSLRCLLAHSQISNLQSRIKDADFDFQSHHGTIAVKNQKLVKKEMELKWLLTREGILRLQIEEAQAKKNTILTEKV